ncbi:MAG: prolipoprotein diacylglyceryl transferase [Spirochaetaceae bacterium]|nr:prolipoprotein diacylglyceryl transferase [Spirochaetaceae bacterium]
MNSYLTAPVFNPILLDLPGPSAISWYGMMYLGGFLFAWFFVKAHIKKQRIIMTNDEFANILVLIFVGVLAGGRLSFCLFIQPAYYLRNPLSILAVWDGGMYFFGGLFAAMFLPWLYTRKTKLNYLDVADLIIIPAPIALAFGRWGNFINGEFWGRPSHAPWAMVFDTVPMTDRFDAAQGWVDEWAAKIGMKVPVSGLVNLPRHPVQLYELVLEGIILFFILLLFRNLGRAKPRGSILSLFLLAYGLMRFWIEFYRNPVSHSGLIMGSPWFTISMLFSLPMILAGIAGLIWSFKQNLSNEIYIRSDFSHPG